MIRDALLNNDGNMIKVDRVRPFNEDKKQEVWVKQEKEVLEIDW